jgi:putative transposase
MSRRKTPSKNETTHITVRCNNNDYLFHLDRTYSAFTSWINSLPCLYDVKIHHALIMSNHIHLLATPAKNNLGKAMGYFLSNLSHYLNGINNRKNHIFSERYGSSIITSSKYLINVIRYIYQNPVRAGIIKDPFWYPYSTLGFYTGQWNPGLIISPDEYSHECFNLGLEGQDQWKGLINNIIRTEDVQILRKSLHRSYFCYTKRQMLELEPNTTSLVI